MNKEHIAQAIREELEKQQKSIRQFAKETGYHHPAIHRIVGGKEGYTIDFLFSVLDALNLDIEIVHRDGMS